MAILKGTEKYNDLKAKVCGTAGYMPPELLNTRSEAARIQLDQDKFDTFALGVIIYELITGTNPFIRNTSKDTIRTNRRCNVNYSHKRFLYCTEEEINLIKQ